MEGNGILCCLSTSRLLIYEEILPNNPTCKPLQQGYVGSVAQLVVICIGVVVVSYSDSNVTVASLQNHTIERIWCEVNQRVNYPIKSILNDMLDKGDVSLDDPGVQYCVSWFVMQVANAGISLFILPWNNHRIPGSYIFYILDKTTVW